MPSKQHRSIAAIAAAMLICMSAAASDSGDGDREHGAPTGRETADVKRDLARKAISLAAEDAIAAVERAMRLNLDSRLNGLTAARTPQESADGR